MEHFFRNDAYGDGDENHNEKISLDELYDRRRQVEKNRMDIYRKILSRVHTKIKLTANSKHNDQYLFYVVPEFIFGIPRYDVNTCVSYIIEKLVENGFHVKYTHPNLLFISWTHYIPSYKRQEIKLKTGITVDGFGNITSNGNGLGNGNDNRNPRLRGKLETVEDMNTLLLKHDSTTQGGHREGQKKDYKDIDSYKPSGIYNSDILNSLKNNNE